MMAMFFAQRVILGKTTFAQVPAKLKEQVRRQRSGRADRGMSTIIFGVSCFLGGAFFGIFLTALLSANHYDDMEGRP